LPTPAPPSPTPTAPTYSSSVNGSLTYTNVTGTCLTDNDPNEGPRTYACHDDSGDSQPSFITGYADVPYTSAYAISLSLYNSGPMTITVTLNSPANTSVAQTTIASGASGTLSWFAGDAYSGKYSYIVTGSRASSIIGDGCDTRCTTVNGTDATFQGSLIWH
jgi:hypothetical protein